MVSLFCLVDDAGILVFVSWWGQLLLLYAHMVGGNRSRKVLVADFFSTRSVWKLDGGSLVIGNSMAVLGVCAMLG